MLSDTLGYTNEEYTKLICKNNKVMNNVISQIKLNNGFPISTPLNNGKFKFCFRKYINEQKQINIQRIASIVNILDTKLEKMYINELDNSLSALINVTTQCVFIRDLETYWNWKVENKQPEDLHTKYREKLARRKYFLQGLLNKVRVYGITDKLNDMISNHIICYSQLVQRSRHNK